MARVKLLVELDIDIDPDDAGSEEGKAITEDDLRYAAHESVAEALDFVQNVRGFLNPIKETEIKIYNVNPI